MNRKWIGVIVTVLILLPVFGVIGYLSTPRELFVSSKQARPSGFMGRGTSPVYSELFVDTLSSGSGMVHGPPVSIFQVSGNEITARFRDPSEKAASYSSGKRYKAGQDKAKITLPSGQSVKLLAIARNRLVDVQPEGENLVPVTWFDPISLIEISNPSKIGLSQTPYVWRHFDTLVLAFEIPDDENETPVQWHNPYVFDRNMQVKVHEMSRWRKHNGILYFALDYPKISNTPLDVLFTIGHGQPEELEIDLRVHTQKNPAIFEKSGTRLSVLHFTDGWVSSSGQAATHTSFEWNPPDAIKEHFQAFATLASSPRYRMEFMQFETLSDENNGNYWKGIWQNGGVGAIGLLKPVAETEKVKLRFFPDVAQCHFEISGFPGDQKVENLFHLKFDSIEFQSHSQIERFYRNHLALDSSALWNDFRNIGFPLSFQNSTAAEITHEIEKAAKVHLRVNPVTYQLEKEPPSAIRRILVQLRSKFGD